MRYIPSKTFAIISGGQTGADRGALDAALHAGIALGGWCPQGRLAEDGVIPERYPLRETSRANYEQRTERNVQEADATLIVVFDQALRGGTALTRELARRHGKPCLIVLATATPAEDIVAWLRTHRVRTLNVAGPRESNAPGIGEATRTLLLAVLHILSTPSVQEDAK